MTDITFERAVELMRANGVRRVAFAEQHEMPVLGERNNMWVKLSEIELFDTLPAPPPEPELELLTQPDELKPENQCHALGCAESGGWMGTRLCRAHGLASAGVKQ
jgi:hypothetical protein